MMRGTPRRLVGLGMATPFPAQQAWVQGSYPDRPCKIIKPKLAEHLGQSGIIENRTDASGFIG
jgi:hypothetical protein